MSFMNNIASRPLSLLSLVVGTAASSAAANMVIDDFAVSSQSLSTTSTTSYFASAAPQNSAMNAAILPVADSLNRRTASANWTTRFSDSQALSQSDQEFRLSSLMVDTVVGRANFFMTGHLTTASVGLDYRTIPGSSFDLAALGSGMRIDGMVTLLSGFSNPMLQGLSLDVVLTDIAGVSGNHTWSGNTSSGGFDGLDGLLEADWTAFEAIQPGTILDLASIASIEVRLNYSYIGLASTPSMTAMYSMNSISVVPAPAAIAFLIAGPAAGIRRRRG